MGAWIVRYDRGRVSVCRCVIIGLVEIRIQLLPEQ